MPCSHVPSSLSILVLYTRAEAAIKGEPIDVIADQETASTAQHIGTALEGLGYRVAQVAVSGDVSQALAPFSPAAWLVFNLCESLDGDSTLEASVPPVLEAHGYAYTGSPGEVLAACLDKAAAKQRLAAHGLATPPYAVLSSPAQECAVPLPALVKPVHEDASVGITLESVVREPEALSRQVEYIVERYRQPALVEQFIAGREFSVGIWGNTPPEPLPPSEILYLDIADPLQRLQTYEAKWVEDSYLYQHSPEVCPADVDGELRGRLVQTALMAYRVMGCRDYARVDMRERDGLPQVLEINPNPALPFYGSIARAARTAGFEYGQLVERIAKMALERAAQDPRCRLHR